MTSKYKTLKLLSNVDLKTGKITLQNGEEVNKKQLESIRLIEKFMSQKKKASSFEISISLIKDKAEYYSHKDAEASLQKDIGFLFIPFVNKYAVNIPTTKIETETLLPEIQPIKKTTITTLKQVQSTTAIFEQKVEYDLESIIPVLKEFSMLVNNVEDQKITKESFEFDMKAYANTKLVFDTKTTWVEKYVVVDNTITTESISGTTKDISTLTITVN